jgi:hypothetical protein
MSNNGPELGLITRRIRGCPALRYGSLFGDNSAAATLAPVRMQQTVEYLSTFGAFT